MGVNKGAAIERFPLGVQSSDHASFSWGTSDFFEKSQRHHRVTCYRRLDELPLE